nr:lysoplasmalogenase [Oceanococcus sp. HetDA_MAG_MS8]
MTGILISICAMGTLLTLAADHYQRKHWEWLGKPMAALSFIFAGLHFGALDSHYGQWILGGLILGAVGDVLLIPPGTGKAFLGGMLAFALGHGLYVVGFAQWPLNLEVMLAATLGMALFAAGVLRWLMPHVGPDFRLPVVVYLLIISAMVVVAVAAVWAGANPLILLGALAFALSDISVARHNFVRATPINRLWGLPLYFASQFIIAASVQP